MSEESILPPAVQVCLESAGLHRKPTWLEVNTDVSLDGKNQPQWLVASRAGISVVQPDIVSAADVSTAGHDQAESARTVAKIVRTVGWAQVESVRTMAGVGSGLLQVQIDGAWIDFLRFSAALAQRFHQVSRRLEVWCQDESLCDETVTAWDNEDSFDPPKCPTCGLRLAKKEVSCPRCLQRGQILQRVWQILKPHWVGALLLSVLTIIGVAAELLPPKLQQYMVDHLLGGKPTSEVDVPTALLLVVMALAASRVMLSVVGVLKGRLSSTIGAELTCNLRLQMVEKLQKLAVSYYDRHHVSSMISRVAHDSEVLHGLMHQITGGFLLQIVKLLGVGVMLFSLNAKLALFTLTPVPLVILGTWIFWKKVYPRYYRLWDASAKQMSAISGMLQGIRVVKAFAQEDREYHRFESAAEHLREWRLWVEYANARYAAAMQVVFALGGLIVWYVGGLDVSSQSPKMTLGELIAFLAYLAMFYAPLGALSNFTTWLTSFLSGSKRVLELLDTPLAISEPENPVPWKQPRGAIHFDHVTFGYDRNQPVLNDVSFEVGAGEMVGIVGRSGSGKTTLVNLLGRFYDAQEGRVTIDGIDVRDMSIHELRENLGIVFQDSYLFRGTIWDNLSYGRPNTAIEEGLTAAKAAGGHDFICRSQLGYETQLGEKGSGLSGGEKQRLSIARTLLYDPKILVLDEATSNIDAESEKSIQDALEILIRGRTTVAIAHRLSTLRNADRILVFDGGRLIEQGSHAQLLALEEGVYARLVRIQMQVSKDPNVDRLLHREEPENKLTVVASHHNGNGNGNGNGAAVAVLAKPRATAHLASVNGHCGVSSNGSTSTTRKKEEGSCLRQEPAAGKLTKQENGGQEETQQGRPADGPRIHWLAPEIDRFHVNDLQLTLSLPADARLHPVFLIRTFPATHPDQYLSVRTWNEKGDDEELGMIRNLTDWSEPVQAILRNALDRRYLLREIRGIESLKLDGGFLEFDVATEDGRHQFTVRWTQSRAVPFGERGKLLIDTNDNRYVIRDVHQLPQPDRKVFLQHVYW